MICEKLLPDVDITYADFSGAAVADIWSAHEAEKPQALAWKQRRYSIYYP